MAAPIFDTEKFINLVKRHPAIYDVNCLQYIDRVAKSNAWFDVCKGMIPGWDTMSEEDKAIEDKCLRNKWRNIRDYFMKEVKAQRRTGRGGRRRKRSTYYNHLLFLIPSVRKRGSRGRSLRVQETKDEELSNEIEIVTTPEIEDDELNGGNDDIANSIYDHHTAVCEATMSTFDDDIAVDVLSPGLENQSNYVADDDYDKMFLLSLLPSLRRIPENLKLHVRIQIQQILASVFHSNNHRGG